MKRLDKLTECALLAIDDPVLLEFGVELFLLDTLVLGEEVAWANKVFQIFWRNTVLNLQALNFRLDDDIVSYDSSHASRSIKG